MSNASSNWHEIAPSQFPWEQEALGFVRGRFPSHEPYRAWSNLEFVAQDGSVNEVDLLVLTPMGFFLVEIKSRPGVIRGDQQHWKWESEDGSVHVADNPLLLANRKAKKLKSLLATQKVFTKAKESCPFLEPLIFCSAPDQTLDLEGVAANRVCLRDREASNDKPARKGIMAALINRDCDGLKQDVPRISKPAARAVSRALDNLGYGPRQRKVGDYELDSIEYESPSGAYQDWRAHHVSLKDASRRIRIYGVGSATSKEERDLISKAAQREAQLLESLGHENIIVADHYTNSELGPALVYRFDPDMTRLDHFLLQHHKSMEIDARLSILRQIAEALKFAHGKGVVHRSLAPQSVFVRETGSSLDVKIMNWQAGRLFASSTVSSRNTCSLHPDQLVEEPSLLYMAPEVLEGESDQCGTYMDVFSLGAMTYLLFSGTAPASSLVELKTKLVQQRGLDLAAALDGTPTELCDLVQCSTHPNVADRIQSIDEFLEYLESVEDELTEPEEDVVENPLDAGKNDLLQGGYRVVERLGKGGSAVVFEVEHNGERSVLKLANRPENNERIEAEYNVLRNLHHHYIVEAKGLVDVSGLTGFTMQSAGEKTLSQRLRDEGTLQLEFLQRFGEDLLEVLRYLEEQGVSHRDIKPDNLGVGPGPSKSKHHLRLFDFSLSQASADNIHAGTPRYREPFLSERKPVPCWDLYAERYSAALTLYEMATGTLPVWGDGQTSPELLDCEATISPEAFDSSIRSGMVRFFEKALRRDPAARFDNAELMLRAWHKVFNEARESTTAHETVDRDQAIAHVSLETPIVQLGISALARQALDRINAITVDDLLRIPFRVLQRLKGTGADTRTEIRNLVRSLRKARPDLVEAVEGRESEETQLADGSDVAADIPPEKASVDLIEKAVRPSERLDEEERSLLRDYLGVEPVADLPQWPSIQALSQHRGVTKNAAWRTLEKARKRWSRLPVVTHLADDAAAILDRFGGVLAVSDLASAILAARGSVLSGDGRQHVARAVLRSVMEVERVKEAPRFIEYRQGTSLLIVRSPALGDYAMRLGQKADELAAMDPILPSARAVEILRDEALPEDAEPIANTRDLLRLAVAASQTAALSSKQELYPQGMDATRTLRLAQGALSGIQELPVELIRQRVRSRYPEAAPLPDRPQLDDALSEIGLDVSWDPAALAGKGAFVIPTATWTQTSSGSSGTAPGAAPGEMPTREEIDVRLFERKLASAERDGAFLVLTAPLKRLGAARKRLCEVCDVDPLDLDAVFVDAMQETARKKKVDWTTVLNADGSPRDSRDWTNLQRLVELALPEVESRVAADGRTLLAHNAGLLARYNHMKLLQRLIDRIGGAGKDALYGLWLLLPEDSQHTRPVVDGKPVPVFGAGQYAQVPKEWIGKGSVSRPQIVDSKNL